MNKKKARKLALDRKVVRRLTGPALDGAVGGTTNAYIGCGGGTITCVSCQATCWGCSLNCPTRALGGCC